ncbi:MAG: hypothetical protein WC083_06375 [Candidatus Methanomethylophilaceae archaeon]|jgi:hypothetical protein
MKYEKEIVFFGVLTYLVLMALVGICLCGIMGSISSDPSLLTRSLFMAYGLAIPFSLGVWIVLHLRDGWMAYCASEGPSDPALQYFSVAICLIGTWTGLVPVYGLLGRAGMSAEMAQWFYAAVALLITAICYKKVHAHLLARASSPPEPGA